MWLCRAKSLPPWAVQVYASFGVFTVLLAHQTHLVVQRDIFVEPATTLDSASIECVVQRADSLCPAVDLRSLRRLG
jgi:hypothetical protein